MGKRSKKASKNSVVSGSKVIEKIDTSVIQDGASNDENPQKSKKRKNKTEVTENKNNIAKNAVVTEEAQEEKIVKNKDKSNNKNKRKQNNPDKNKSNKKIIFQEDTGEPIEVATTCSKEVNNKQNTDLEQVKDEDIDKFCDELTEEDNVQYESWIEQIEAKLKGNKKSSKTYANSILFVSLALNIYFDLAYNKANTNYQYFYEVEQIWHLINQYQILISDLEIWVKEITTKIFGTSISSSHTL